MGCASTAYLDFKYGIFVSYEHYFWWTFWSMLDIVPAMSECRGTE